MMWVGWIIAVVAIGAAVWLARQLASERALTTQLRFAKIEAENATDAMRQNQAQAVGAAGLAPLGRLLGSTAHELDAPLASVRSQVDHAARQLVDYRTLVKRYDTAVQYCLQPVELIFGADKQSLDKLVVHVEGARRALFEARANLEKSSALDESRHLLETAAESLRDIGALTQSLSQFAENRPADAQPVDVNLSIDHALRIAERRLRGRIEIVRDYRELPKITAEPGELAQVFLHLINNASEAMNGVGKLSVATRTSGNLVEIDVGDTGPGIAEEMLGVIFDPFVTTKSADAAGGIGLTVVRQIVGQLGGSVKVRTKAGAGSVFTVVLPVHVRHVPA
ncbi:MAG TPA: ATP-binding protein [Rhodanobacteraceae bacterium]|nr:ATP-binding protein [Rhodanobacteraceae bacterium]